ncbi:MAG TPA: TOBE domain-containing protein, partial [Thalassobaculum sp.]
GDRSPLRIEVKLVEHLGADTLVYGSCPALVASDGNPLMTVRLNGHHQPAMGEAIGLAADPADLHLFDAVTGKRI